MHLFPFLFLPGSSSSMRVSGWGSIPVISSIQIICLSLGKFYRYKRLFNNTIMGMFQELILPLPGMNIGGGKRNVEHCFLNERRRRGRTPIFLAPFDAELNPRCFDVILSPIYFYWQNYGDRKQRKLDEHRGRREADTMMMRSLREGERDL